jgi:hypothetical protein
MTLHEQGLIRAWFQRATPWNPSLTAMAWHQEILPLPHVPHRHMVVDAATLAALDVFREDRHPSNMGIGTTKEGFSAYGVLQRCATPMVMAVTTGRKCRGPRAGPLSAPAYSTVQRIIHTQNPGSDRADPRSDRADPRSDRADPRSDRADPRSDRADPRSDRADPRSDRADPRSNRAARYLNSLCAHALLCRPDWSTS